MKLNVVISQRCLVICSASHGLGRGLSPRKMSFSPQTHNKTDWSRIGVSINPTVIDFDRFCSQNL